MTQPVPTAASAPGTGLAQKAQTSISPQNVVQLAGRFVQFSGKTDAVNGSPNQFVDPTVVTMNFSTQDRDPADDNNRQVTGAPGPGQVYAITGEMTDALGRTAPMQGFLVDVSGPFNWIMLTSGDGQNGARFFGYVSQDGLIAGTLGQWETLQNGTIFTARTSEAGQ